jgi:hypothetical protein
VTTSESQLLHVFFIFYFTLVYTQLLNAKDWLNFPFFFRYLVAATTLWSGLSYIYSKDAVKILTRDEIERRTATAAAAAAAAAATAGRRPADDRQSLTTNNTSSRSKR